jgi:hypothetical protein
MFGDVPKEEGTTFIQNVKEDPLTLDLLAIFTF